MVSFQIHKFDANENIPNTCINNVFEYEMNSEFLTIKNKINYYSL